MAEAAGTITVAGTITEVGDRTEVTSRIAAGTIRGTDIKISVLGMEKIRAVDTIKIVTDERVICREAGVDMLALLTLIPLGEEDAVARTILGLTGIIGHIRIPGLKIISGDTDRNLNMDIRDVNVFRFFFSCDLLLFSLT